MPQNARDTAFTLSELLKENQQGGGKNTPLPLPRLGFNISLLIQKTRLTDFINVSLQGVHLILCSKRKEIVYPEKKKKIGACTDLFRIAISLYLVWQCFSKPDIVRLMELPRLNSDW